MIVVLLIAFLMLAPFHAGAGFWPNALLTAVQERLDIRVPKDFHEALEFTGPLGASLEGYWNAAEGISFSRSVKWGAEKLAQLFSRLAAFIGQYAD